MADINLLQNQLRDTTLAATRRTRLFVVIFSIIAVLLIAGGAALYFLTSRVSSDTAVLSQTNAGLQKSLSTQQKDLANAQAYQAQLSNVNLLLNNHVFITPILEELGKYTYLKAQFLNLGILQETGKIHVEGVVDSYEGLGKLLLGLSTSVNFKNVKLLSVMPSSGQTSGYNFSIDMLAAQNIFVNPK